MLVLQSPMFAISLKGEAASLADRYGLAIGLPAATALLLNKQLLYRCTHGIGRNVQIIILFCFDNLEVCLLLSFVISIFCLTLIGLVS